MENGRLAYLTLFLDSVDYVTAGKKGEISENRKLVSLYEPSFYSVIEPHLRNSDARVRRETVILLTKLRERKAAERIREMRVSDNELVSGACLGYLEALGDDDDAVPRMLDEMRHSNGADFKRAAMRLRGIARAEDVDAIRVIYGQVEDELKQSVVQVLNAIIARYPELRPKEYLILSEPVYPNERKLRSFLDKSIVYMDIRYRDNYADDASIDIGMYNRIASAFRKIQVRLYNEKANLKYYSSETKEMFDEAGKLLIWAMNDLSSKDVIGAGSDDGDRHCPRCGCPMVHSLTGWTCPECGHKA